ncbi:MAG TPA: hypothetical protein VJ816_01925 [Gemmatimonadales bacterium]|nr:hypothetical protein [Gemmatimonadales bacterium]
METSGYGAFLLGLLSERERFFEAVVEGEGLGSKLRYAFGTMLGLSAFYGLVAGAYSGWAQALSTAIKVPVLLLATLIVCFPVFFVVQVLMGSRLRLEQVLVLVVSSLALMSILLAAFVPITAFFLLTGANYYFQHLLHIAIAGVAGLFGMFALHDGLAVICEKRNVYPRRALTMMRIWAVLFAFVGIQMAWNLRPFLSDRREPFQVIGHYQGNFYAAVIFAVNKLLSGEPKPLATPPPARTVPDLFPQDSQAKRP